MNIDIIYYLYFIGYILNLIVLLYSNSLKNNYMRMSKLPRAYILYCLGISIFWIFILPHYINNYIKFFYNTPLGKTIYRMNLKKDTNNLLKYQKFFKFDSQEYKVFEELDKLFKKLNNE